MGLLGNSTSVIYKWYARHASAISASRQSQHLLDLVLPRKPGTLSLEEIMKQAEIGKGISANTYNCGHPLRRLQKTRQGRLLYDPMPEIL
jgi:hypothetical protein